MAAVIVTDAELEQGVQLWGLDLRWPVIGVSGCVIIGCTCL